MSPFTLIYLREVRVRLRDWRFWVGLLALPLVGGALFALPGLLRRGPQPLTVFVVGDSTLAHASVPEVTFQLIPFSAADSFKAHLSPNQALLLYEADSGPTPRLRIFSQEGLSPMQEDALRGLLRQHILTQKAQQLRLSPETLAYLLDPPKISFYEIAHKKESQKGLATIASSLLNSLLYLLIMLTGYATLLSTLEEKSNRLAEYLLIYTSPEQLLMGKVLAMVSLTLLQLSLWAGFGVVALRQLPPEVLVRFGQLASPLVWGEIGGLVLLGVLLYAFLYAAAGATSDSVTELSGLAQTLQWPLVLAFILVFALQADPTNPFLRGLSLFPLTAPLAMPVRLLFGMVPLWERLIALLLLGLTIGLSWILAARIYRGALLLYGQKLSWRAIWHLIRR